MRLPFVYTHVHTYVYRYLDARKCNNLWKMYKKKVIILNESLFYCVSITYV